MTSPYFFYFWGQPCPPSSLSLSTSCPKNCAPHVLVALRPNLSWDDRSQQKWSSKNAMVTQYRKDEKGTILFSMTFELKVFRDLCVEILPICNTIYGQIFPQIFVYGQYFSMISLNLTPHRCVLLLCFHWTYTTSAWKTSVLGPTEAMRRYQQPWDDFVYLPSLHGCFLKWWYPTTMGFPTKTDHFGVFWGYHHLRKHPHGFGWFPRLC